MKARRFYKVSYAVLYVLLALVLVAVALFFGVGYDNPVGDYNLPLNTDVLLYVVYAMTVLAVGVALGAVALRFARVWRQTRRRAYRLVAGTGLFSLLLGVTLLCASSRPMLVNGEWFESVVWLRVTDMLLYAIYLLLVVAVLCAVLSVTGVFRRIHFKR